MSSKIEVLGGQFVDPLALNPDDIRIEDIAHALSMQCRFSGYTSRHYSVAEHSVYVARIVAARLAEGADLTKVSVWESFKSEEYKRPIRQALLHDATEAYLVDLPSPLKRHFPEFRAAEKKLWTVIAKRFDVPEEMHPWVKEADGRMCTTEKVALLSPDTHMLEWRDFARDFPPYTGEDNIINLYPVAPAQARRRFLDFYDQVKA